MAVELRPGVSRALFANLTAEQQARTKKAMTALALVVERQAKTNLSGFSHRYGTPTPARPGEGPAKISGNLARSVTHTPAERTGTAWVVLVGTGVGFYPTYTTKRGRVFRGKTPANVYGRILEVVGSRAGHKYPWLEPAARFGERFGAPTIFKVTFGAGWRQLV
jgi:hypothetical protein